MRMIFCLLFLVMPACSYDDGNETVIRKKPRPAPAPADPWVQLAPLVESSCGGCHGEGKPQLGIDSLDRLRNAKPRIENDTMPPGGGLDPEVKAKLLGA